MRVRSKDEYPIKYELQRLRKSARTSRSSITVSQDRALKTKRSYQLYIKYHITNVSLTSKMQSVRPFVTCREVEQPSTRCKRHTHSIANLLIYNFDGFILAQPKGPLYRKIDGN